MSKILITGASGLIGKRLTELLVQQGHEVMHLGRTKKVGKIPSFVWDVEAGMIEEDAFHGVDAVVNLAGAGVADHRWTKKRKQEILESRTKSTALLARYLEKYPHVKVFVAASAIGYYGFGLADKVFTEMSDPGKDYLAEVVKAWEDETAKIQNSRVVKLRIGIVLSERGGALKEMVRPVQWSVGASLGTGMQYISWIHIDDVCHMFIKALEDNSMRGAYNATGPYAVTNKELTRAIAKALHKPLWLPPIPPFVLKVLIGGLADSVVNGSNVSSKKIQETGFIFQFRTLEEALKDLLKV